VTGDPLVRETPAWFDESKLGIFIHWNPASIPAYAPLASLAEMYAEDPSGTTAFRRLPYAEMYWNSMSIAGSATARHHAERYPGLGYEAFVEEFRDRSIPAWDPAPWADLCARAGARYVVLTTKMEDGFLMWPSARRNPHRPGWGSERDVVGEMAAAVRDRGMRFGTYYCGGVDWTFKGLPITSTAGMVAAMIDDADYAAYADAHWRELIDRYQPCVLWNDLGYPACSDLEGLFRHYFERVPDGVVNNRFQSARDFEALLEAEAQGASPDLGHAPVYSDFLTPEYSTAGSPETKWETCRGLSESFGFNRLDDDRTYLSPTELIHTLVDVVARGGNLLINLGPNGAGLAPWLQAERLLMLGWWLRVNGEAIFATRPWERHAGITGEGIAVRYTRSEDAVYAVVLGTPAGDSVELDLRLGGDAAASLLGHHARLAHEESPGGTRISLPTVPDPGAAFALRLEPAGAVSARAPVPAAAS
jgi:alpha-L-fucosidase